MSNDWTEDDYFRADAVAHLSMVFGNSYDDVVAGMRIGIKLHDADPVLAKRLFSALTTGDSLKITGVIDQLAATMQSWGKR
jgi:hypothetical protein